jgi:hypothetical protein
MGQMGQPVAYQHPSLIWLVHNVCEVVVFLNALVFASEGGVSTSLVLNEKRHRLLSWHECHFGNRHGNFPGNKIENILSKTKVPWNKHQPYVLSVPNYKFVLISLDL